jgi:LDH2 family malate/lactate/ureidoglycolate dehydrogenase
MQDGIPMPAGPAPDPHKMRHDYFLLPFGGAKGSHKGYGVAAIIDILCNTLSGAGPAWRNKDSCAFYLAISIESRHSSTGLSEY